VCQAELEPQLKEQLMDIVEFEDEAIRSNAKQCEAMKTCRRLATACITASRSFLGREDIGLGTSPMRLEGITSSTSSEELFKSSNVQRYSTDMNVKLVK